MPGAFSGIRRALARGAGGVPASISASLRTSLVAYWKLNEVSGTRADSVGANTLADNNTVTSATGVVGSAASFASANSESLSIDDNAALSLADGPDASIAFWLKLTTVATARLVSKWDNTAGDLEYSVLVVTDKVRFAVSGDGTAAPSVEWGSTLSAATWYHVCAWHDSVADIIAISVNNGTPVTLAHTAGIFNSTSVFTLGALSGGGQHLNGALDELGIWKKVLTPAERDALYNSGAGLTYPFTG